ncbi:hypothetical protein LINPERHAP1_LOCUS8460 [Linum perenne]
MLIGFVIEWDFCKSYDRNGHQGIALLKLCSDQMLVKFIVNKEINFGGVHISQDLEKLKIGYDIVVSNPVELSELPATMAGFQCLMAYGARELACFLLKRKYNTKEIFENVFFHKL